MSNVSNVSNETLEDLRPGPRDRTVRDAQGRVRDVPAGWELLPPGDALLTRRVKADGPYWAVAEKVGRRVMSRGLWAPAARIAVLTERAAAERLTPAYARKLEAGRARRDREQSEYVVEFTRHIVAFLRFAPVHQALGHKLATRVAEHATPVGSGTVARTERIPVAQRAEAAVIAWLRHQTTAYDNMQIARVKGERREVRRQLAERSRALLDRYRRGEPIAPNCALAAALAAPVRARSEAEDADDLDGPDTIDGGAGSRVEARVDLRGDVRGPNDGDEGEDGDDFHGDEEDNGDDFDLDDLGDGDIDYGDQDDGDDLEADDARPAVLAPSPLAPAQRPHPRPQHQVPTARAVTAKLPAPRAPVTRVPPAPVQILDDEPDDAPAPARKTFAVPAKVVARTPTPQPPLPAAPTTTVDDEMARRAARQAAVRARLKQR